MSAKNWSFGQFLMSRFSSGKDSVPRQRRNGFRWRPLLEALEDRTLPSTILWTNRGSAGNDSDGFNAVFASDGNLARADLARQDVDAAIANWQATIASFNYSDASLNDTFHLSISMGGDTGISAYAEVNNNNNGKPTEGSVHINTGNDAHGAGYYLDPTPQFNEEYSTALNAYAALPDPAGPVGEGFDFRTIAMFEMSHCLGLFDDSSLLFIQDANHYLTNTGQNDAIDQSGKLWTYNGPDVQALFTSNNGGPGGHDEGLPLHTARDDIGNVVTVGGTTFFGAEDSNNAFAAPLNNYRLLVSRLDALVLEDSYGYTVNEPAQNFYINLNPSTGALMVRGGQAGDQIYGYFGASNDLITVDSWTRLGQPEIRVSVTIGNPVPGTGPNLPYTTSFPAQSVSSIMIDAGSNAGTGEDTVNLESVPGPTAITIDANFSDSINLSPAAHNLTNLGGASITINRAPWAFGNDTLVLNDQANPDGMTYTVTGAVIDAVLTGTTTAVFVRYPLLAPTVGEVTINGAGGVSTYKIDDTLPGSSLTINSGNPADTIAVSASGESLLSIQGQLTFNGMGSATMTLNDQNNPPTNAASPQSIEYQLTDSSVYVTDSPGFDPPRPASAALINYSGLAFLTLNGGTGPGHTYQIDSTAPRTASTINPAGVDDVVNVETTGGPLTTNFDFGPGNPTINVSPVAEDLRNIGGDLTVNGGTLVLNDQNDTDALLLPLYSMNGSSVVRPYLQHTLTINHDVGDLTLNGAVGVGQTYFVGQTNGWTTTLNTANGNDEVNVDAISGTLNVNLAGTGNPTVNVSPTGEFLGSIQGSLSVHGRGSGTTGSGTLVINDQENTPTNGAVPQTSFSYVLTDSHVSVTDVPGFIDFDPDITSQTWGLDYDGLANVTLYGGAGRGHSYEVRNTAAPTNTTIVAAGVDDTVNVDATTGPLTVQLAGSGNPIVTVSPTAHNLEALLGTLTIAGQGVGSVILDDQNAGGDVSPYTLTSLSLSYVFRPAAPSGPPFGQPPILFLPQLITVNYSGISALTLNGSGDPSGRTYNVSGTALGTTTTINAATGNDTVNVEATTGPLFVNLLAAAGNPIVNVSPTARNLNAIRGNLTVGGLGIGTLNIDDQAASAGRSYTFTSTSLAWGGPAAISFSNLGLVVLNGTAFNDTVTFQSLPGSPVMVNGGGGANNTLIGPDTTNTWLLAQPSGHEGTLNTVVEFDSFGSLIGGQGRDSFVVPDGVSIPEFLSGGDGLHGGANNTLDLSAYMSPLIEHIMTSVYGGNVTLAGGNATPVVRAFALCQNVIGGASDDHFIFNQGFGLTTVDGGPGNNTLDFSPYFLPPSFLTPPAWVFEILGHNSGLVAGAIANYSRIQNLIGTKVDDRYGFRGTAYLDGTIDGQAGNNSLEYTQSTANVTVDLQNGLASFVHFQGGSAPQPGGIFNFQKFVGSQTAPSTLIGADTNNQWTVTDPNSGTVGADTFRGFQNLVGGAMADTFVFQQAGSLAGSVDGGGGTDTLDYSQYTGDVTVDLTLNLASLVHQGASGNVLRIANVTGSNGNNLLVGDANANVLIGGTGRNVLIGGGGGDTLDASRATGDNLLIGGRTDFDAWLAALDAVFAEWTRLDLGFRDRFSDLTGGSNGTGSPALNVVNGQLIRLTAATNPQSNNGTVHADSSPDTLIGSNLVDPATGKRVHNWFFDDSDDLLTNFDHSSDHETQVR
jgi:hypothetical protein